MNNLARAKAVLYWRSLSARALLLTGLVLSINAAAPVHAQELPEELSSELPDQIDQILKDQLRRGRMSARDTSFCYQIADAEGKPSETSGNMLDRPMRPASVTKLYVTLWALETLGSDYRFKTDFYLKDGHLHIKGGNDTFFTSENLLYLLSELNHRGINRLDKVTFSHDFFFNFSESGGEISAKFKRYLNSHLWTRSIHREFKQLRKTIDKLGLDIELEDQIKFRVGSIAKLAATPSFALGEAAEENLLVSFHSSSLYRHLKEMNIYSNNFMAQKIFDMLGGSEQMQSYLNLKFQTTKEQAYFYTGSGLGENYTTCRLTLSMIQELMQIIKRQALFPQDLMSVAGVDSGTLVGRFTANGRHNMVHRMVMAKTGTLHHTASLAGIVLTNQGPVPFGIFNHTTALDRARSFQDELLADVIGHLGEGEALSDYDAQEFIPLMGTRLEFKE